jgi:uncharacterized protein (TIGR03792 family)
MVIEWLRFDVPTARRSAFLERDARVWTQALAKYPGFISKETWFEPQTNATIAVIRWQTLEDWKRIPRSDLELLDSQMGELLMAVQECKTFHTDASR